VDNKVITVDMYQHKKYEILAALIHFANNGYILKDATSYTTFEDTLYFKKVDPFEYPSYDLASNEYNLSGYTIKIEQRRHANSSVSARYVFKFDKYSQNDISYITNYNQYCDIQEVDISDNGVGSRAVNYYFQNLDTVDGIKKKFQKDIITLVDSVKFYEEHSQFLIEMIKPFNKGIKKIYKCQKYIDGINEYISRNIVSEIQELFNCVYEKMRVGKEIRLGNFVSIHKASKNMTEFGLSGLVKRPHNISYRESIPEVYTNFMRVFLPIFNQLGGQKKLLAEILMDRLVEE